MTPLARAVLLTLVLLGTASAAAARPDPVGSEPEPGVPDPGREIYVAQCAACHMPTGRGIPATFPPLAGSEWVLGDARMIVRILLHGLSGEMEVAGASYDGLMPALGAVLTDAEIAAVSTYVRASWGNGAGAVPEALVARERAATRARGRPWTAEELAGSLETVK